MGERNEKCLKRKHMIAGIVTLIVVLFIGLYVLRSNPMESEKESIDLVFIEDEHTLGDLYRLDSETDKLINLTNNKQIYKSVTWSPNGKQIAFTQSSNSKWQTYMMKDDGTDMEPVKGTTSLDKVSGWSPDGKYLLLSSYRDVDQEIYGLELKTGKAINLTSHPADDYMPVWSPDGEKIAFVSNRSKQGWHSKYELYIMTVSDGNVTKVETDDKSIQSIVWSPNSVDLAVALEEPYYNTSVYITDIASSKLDRLEIKSKNLYPQHWSNDGENILINKITYSHDYKPTYKPFWINLKDNSKKEIEFEPGCQVSTYTLKSHSGRHTVVTEHAKDKSVGNKREKIALMGGTLIDGNGGHPIEDAIILIDHGVIEYVGHNKSNKVPDDYKCIDVQGGYILPGFINAHVHYGFHAYNLKEWAKQGVTTVRDLGADISQPLFDMRDNINARPEYARVIMVGPMFTVPGGYPQGPWALRITSVQDAREKTLDIINKGADVIKVALETGEPFGEIYPILSQEELTAIVEVAHSKDIKVTAHVSVSNSSNIETAINAGVDDIAHNWMTNVHEDILSQMVENNMYLVPTQEVLQYNAFMTKINLINFIKLGGLVALGNDYGGDPYWKEMDLGMPMYDILSMQDSGMTPMEIIVAATKNAAAVCGREEILGTIENGKIGDILILKDNPLENIENLQKVKMVIKDGVIIFN